MRAAAPALISLLLASGCALVELRRLDEAWPEAAGRARAEGLQAPIKLTRDDLGVPHIRAESELDAWYGLGFAHGQDRLFQADLMRHLGFGRLSEWLGASTVELDAFMQGMRLRRQAQLSIAGLPLEERRMLEAYAAGLNAGAASLEALPIEYRLLGVEFEPWLPEDSAATLFLQSWYLSSNPDFELVALMLRDPETGERLDRATLDRLFRLEPGIPPADRYWDQLKAVRLGAFTPAFEAFTGALGGRPEGAQASNSWVVGGARTASGLPILANDPHLSQTVPSLWYLADVAGGPLHAAGSTLPGVPGVVLGHNERVAWGFTNVMADVVDFAVLRRVGEQAVVYGGEVRALDTVQVEIAVKGQRSPERREVLLSPVGPVVTANEGSHVLAMRWHALEIEDRSARLLRGLNLSRDAADVLALRTVPSIAAQNIAYADVDGAWGWQSMGSVPRRTSHTGRLPYPASDPDFGWDGWYGVLPGEAEPERGYALTANSLPPTDTPAGGGEPIDVAHISSAWAPPARYDRIDEQLAAARDVTPADMHALQLDVLDPTARRWLPELLSDAVRFKLQEGRLCYEVLAGWDYRADAGGAGPTVWAYFQRELLREALRDTLGEEGVDLYLQVASPGRSLFHGDLDALLTDRDAQVAAAMGAACERLEDDLGGDPAGWSWGEAHPLRLQHPFARSSRLLSGWNMPEVPFPGTSTTVAAAGYSWSRPEMKVGGMASLRLVMPLSDLSASTAAHPGGQSGHPGHPDYATHFEAFVGGDRLPLLFDDDDVAARAREVLVLEP